ncbi:MAG: class I SAM-dependent DNA methyltransferase [Halobacteriales archaeon]
MATTDATAGARDRLCDALRDALAAAPRGDPADAGRLACLLVGRDQFASLVGQPPGGQLASLPPPFDAIDVPRAARDAAAELSAASTAADAGPAVIGAGYEAALEAADRGERGKFFTPPAVARSLVAWALAGAPPHDRPPRVLDPAVGTGTFPVAAVDRLDDRDTARSQGRSNFVGIDVDGAALHLAGLRLAAAAGEPAPTELPLYRASFFDCEPAGSDRSADPAVRLEPVDAVVGNPPFVRAEALTPDREHFRAHLAAFGPTGDTPLLDGDDAVSRRADAYVYFVTHATRFLRPGGRLALVLPTKWLMSAYGEDLRRFLRERYRVHAVVGMEGRAFGDALVDTCLLLAERARQPGADEPLRFVRFDSADEPPTLLDHVPGGAGSRERPARTVERSQRVLTASGSLARYLEVPGELLSLFDSPPFVRLDALAEVARGTMTGANRFFFVDGDDRERFGVEPRFLTPAVKSLRTIDRPSLEPTAVDRRLLDVHTTVAEVRASLDEAADPEAAVKDRLAADGHDGLRAYLEHAEANGWHEGRTCRSRAVWFDLGELRAPAAFVPKLLRERVFVVRNAAGAVPSNAIDGVWPATDVDPAVLLAVLNASVGRAAMEVTGRDEAGLLQLMTYETASLPVLDVRTLSGAERDRLASVGDAFATDPGPGTRAALDEAVHAAFDLSLAADTVRAQANALRRRRVDGAESVDAPAD